MRILHACDKSPTQKVFLKKWTHCSSKDFCVGNIKVIFFFKVIYILFSNVVEDEICQENNIICRLWNYEIYYYCKHLCSKIIVSHHQLFALGYNHFFLNITLCI